MSESHNGESARVRGFESRRCRDNSTRKSPRPYTRSRNNAGDSHAQRLLGCGVAKENDCGILQRENTPPAVILSEPERRISLFPLLAPCEGSALFLWVPQPWFLRVGLGFVRYLRVSRRATPQPDRSSRRRPRARATPESRAAYRSTPAARHCSCGTVCARGRLHCRAEN